MSNQHVDQILQEMIASGQFRMFGEGILPITLYYNPISGTFTTANAICTTDVKKVIEFVLNSKVFRNV